jgi:exosome complex RNA-binding protein Rrp4
VRNFLAGPNSLLRDYRGHGTYVDGDEVVASVAGTIERVNKLVTVRALRTRYAR